MVERKLQKWQIAVIAVIVLTIPFILVYQLALKPDIVIDTRSLENSCFVGQQECMYSYELDDPSPDIELIHLIEGGWRITGEDVWCFKIVESMVEPVNTPANNIFRESNVECNNVVIFDDDEWDASFDIVVPDEEGNLIPKFTSIIIPEGAVQIIKFTMKGI